MKLLEHEAKAILKGYGIKTPRGLLAETAKQAAAAAQEIGCPVFLKAQVAVSGRGKAGGILPAATIEEASSLAARLLNMRLKGLPVSSLLVEERLEIEAQYYLSLAVDRQARSFVVLASTRGGVDIEDVAFHDPELILRHWISPLAGLSEKEAAGLALSLGLQAEEAQQVVSILLALYRAALEQDAELVELNPLAKCRGGLMVAADARLIIDDNALFRHPDLAARTSFNEGETRLELQARQKGLAYIDLDGDIGVIGNGAGLVMATLDLVQHYGGRPANFLDVGGGARGNTVRDGLLLVMSKPGVRSVLINILGGITRCDQVANGVVEALEASPVKITLAIRMMGTNEVEGREILRRHSIEYYPDMEQAAAALIRRS